MQAKLQHSSGRMQAQCSGRATSSSALGRPSSSSSSARRSRPLSLPRLSNWRYFGPTAEYSDGDADYFATTSRLSQQYEWFAPGREQEEAPEVEEQEQERAPYGLTPRQIAALGLTGPRTDMPDPVSMNGCWAACRLGRGRGGGGRGRDGAICLL